MCNFRFSWWIREQTKAMCKMILLCVLVSVYEAVLFLHTFDDFHRGAENERKEKKKNSYVIFIKNLSFDMPIRCMSVTLFFFSLFFSELIQWLAIYLLSLVQDDDDDDESNWKWMKWLYVILYIGGQRRNIFFSEAFSLRCG